MSDPTSIFNESHLSTQTPEPVNGSNVNNASSSDDLANLLGSIKNERGEVKYKTIEEALKGLKHSQEYIPQLTTQLSQKDSELKEAKAAAERVAELERSIEALTQKKEEPSTPTSSISEEQIAEYVNRTLTKKQQEDAQKANLTSVVHSLQTQHGADAEKVYNAKAQEIGMSVQEFNALAARNPKAVLSLLGVAEKPQQKVQQQLTSFNTDGFQPQQDSFIGRNIKPTLIGATSQDLREESSNAKRMVEELHKQGKSVHDLTDPKVYFKQFNK